MNTDIFKIENGRIRLNKYKIILRKYTSAVKDIFTDEEIYLDEGGMYEYEVNFVPKHQLLEIIVKEEVDTSEYAWMEGIEVDAKNRQKEIERIAAYGSLEAYEASLPYTDAVFKVETDFRLSKLELGI